MPAHTLLAITALWNLRHKAWQEAQRKPPCCNEALKSLLKGLQGSGREADLHGDIAGGQPHDAGHAAGKALPRKLRQHDGQQRALVAAHQVVRNAVACITRKDLEPQKRHMAHAKQL